MDNFFNMEPTFVYAPPQDCQPPIGADALVAPCLGYTWPTTLELVQTQNVLCPDASGKVVPAGTREWLAAVPKNRNVFCFTVLPGTFRLVHVRWDLECNNVALRIKREVVCRNGGCEDTVTTTCWPRRCMFTILPPGRYQLWLDASRVFVDEGMLGSEVDVSVTLEYVTRDFVLAASLASE